MRAFESKNPDISSSERTKNVKSKTIYKTMRTRAQECKGTGKNYTGTMIFKSMKLGGTDTGTQVTNYRSYDLANTMARGAALVWDNCCKGIAGQFGNPGKQFEGWNANGIEFTWADNDIGITGITGGTDITSLPPGGSGIWIDPSNNLFGTKDDCNLDKFLNYYGVTGAYYRFQKGNNTRNNYMVGYQQIGGNKNRTEPWLLWSNTVTPGATCCNPQPPAGPATPAGQVIANMPANRGQSPAVAGYNNKLYVFGGKYGGGPTPPYSTYDTFVVYDTVTNSWSSPTPTMSKKRAWVYGAIWQDKVYIYSGTDDQQASSHQSMEIYDITNNTFSTVALTPDKRTNYAAGAINGKIYICGGYSYSVGTTTDSLIEYDITTDSFTTKAVMPVARQQHAAAVYDNKLYVMGGYGNPVNNSLIVYDPADNTWTTLTDMPESRYNLSAATLGSYIYAVGGSDGGLKNTVYKYDPAFNTWSTIVLYMQSPRAEFGLGVANNAMFAVGNYNGTQDDGERIL